MPPRTTAQPPIYETEAFYDEALTRDGRPRPHYERLLAALAADPAAAQEAARRRVDELGISFGKGPGEQPFIVDPVPRILAGDEWAGLAEGLSQRAQALNAFVADVYGERAIVRAGVVPAGVVETSAHLEPALADVDLGPAPATIAGFDLVRGPDGIFRVLEDNVRTPSGIAYAIAARKACDPWLGELVDPRRRHFRDFFPAFEQALRAAAPNEREDPLVVLLSDGPENIAWYEHEMIEEEIDIRLARREELAVRDGRLWLEGTEPAQVDVVCRRTDEDRLHDDEGHETWLGELLLEPLRQGTVRVANAFGCGVADDKLAHVYVEAMVRFYLGEEPLIASVESHDLVDSSSRERARERLRELVIKPRGSYGGEGVVIGSEASDEELRSIAAEIEHRPEAFVAQEILMLSRHPTVCGGRLEPRHVDLRAFVVTAPTGATVAPGGLTRVALERGSLLVNSSQGGGGKDTWVLE